MQDKGTLEEGFIRKGDIGYKQLLMIHMIRISAIICKLSDEGMSFNLIMSVRAFETMLSPYLDQKYKEDIVKIEKKWEDYYNKEILNKSENVAEKKRENRNRESSLDIFQALCELMGRRNLLIEPDIEIDWK